MAGSLPEGSTEHLTTDNRLYGYSHVGSDYDESQWYFSRKEIEENSPSRRDGIDSKKETYLRKSYCTFLQDLGMRLKVPQVTIATAIIFCHRFFLRQSLAKNDRRTIATVCMFLAGKVEETPRLLKDVIHLSYEIMHKKDPAASQRIKQKEVYEQQKVHILLGEKVVLSTLGFDLNLLHPYKPLVEAIKRFKVSQNALAQVAWNFVNDGLRTSLCLQYQPHHIAAGAIFLAAKFLKVKLPSDGDRVWWQEFDVTPRQLEDVSNQMLELYEQNRSVQAPSGSELDGSIGHTTTAHRSVKTAASGLASANIRSQGGAASDVKHGASLASSARSLADQLCSENQSVAHPRNEVGNSESMAGPGVCGMNEEGKKSELLPCGSEKLVEASSASDSQPVKHPTKVEAEGEQGAAAAAGCGRSKDGGSSSFKPSAEAGQSPKEGEAPKARCLPDVMKRIDKDKVKAALEKRKRSRGDRPKNTELVDEDDLIERELESGVELGAEDEGIREERANRSNASSYEPEGAEDRGRREQDNADKANHAAFDGGDGRGWVGALENGVIRHPDPETAGETPSIDREASYPHKLDSCRDKAGSTVGRQLDDKVQRPGKSGWPDYMERDAKRHRQETHI